VTVSDPPVFDRPVSDPLSVRRLYGRAKSHALRPRAERLVADLLPQLRVPQEGLLDPLCLFGRNCPLALEIGFGKGDHLAFQARARPDMGFIGAEPYLDGVARLLAEIEDFKLDNIRIHQGDALDILERLPDASLDAAYLLHPDPWPKTRHAKRRFVNPGPMALLAAKLKPGASLRIATDHPGYLRHTLRIMQQMAQFEWQAEQPADWSRIPADWPDTRFAQKARALGHDVWRLIYARI